jgi:hypothetical protein
LSYFKTVKFIFYAVPKAFFHGKHNIINFGNGRVFRFELLDGMNDHGHKILHEIQITLCIRCCLFSESIFLVVNKCPNGCIRFACTKFIYNYNYELTIILISDIKKTKFLNKKDNKGRFHEIKDQNVLIMVLNHEGQKHQNKDDPYS